MSEKFARELIINLNRRIRSERHAATKAALRHMKEAIIETMESLGHNIV